MNINNIIKIIKGKDYKLIVFIGPCSVHNINSFIKLAKIIKKIEIRFNRRIVIVIRVYLEKPRTINGWKGLIYDPFINGTYNLSIGIKQTISMLKKVREMKLLMITEYLNIELAQIIYKYIDIGTIGARTCESQVHRELINMINCPVGIKNNTNGDIIPAINTIKATRFNNIFITKSNDNKLKLIKTIANDKSFLILRGGLTQNYKKDLYKRMIIDIKKNDIGVVIDCNHSNSNKNIIKQNNNFKYIIKNINKYSNLIGIMVEVNIFKGRQDLNNRINKYISITDPCSDIISCFRLIKKLYYNINK